MPTGSPSLTVVDPGGNRTRVDLSPLPFRIGRQPDNDFIVRDNRVSRSHARIVQDEREYVIEDIGSRHGTFVNGQRVERHKLNDGDKIELGSTDSYQLIFTAEGSELARLAGQFDAPSAPATVTGVGGNLARLRAILEVARTLQTSFSTQDVLVAVVDAALAVTGAERGFLLLTKADDLEIRVARSRHGATLADTDLRVSRRVIHRALHHRRDLFYMNFDPQGADGTRPDASIADLELRSVVCVPLVRIQTGASETTTILTTGSETVGVLYMDSRAGTADLAGGNRELLQSLAIEASTVLENARLLDEERIKQRIEEELRVARAIQQNLLPRELPGTGWFRACGSSLPSHEIGGDYFDVIRVDGGRWFAMMADVSGKGPSAALLAALLQGAFLTAPGPAGMRTRMSALNRFLHERTGGEKYATIFYFSVDQSGRLDWINAAHCPPIVAHAGALLTLEPTGPPVGLLVDADFQAAESRLAPGDKLIVYTDGITEARNGCGDFFGRKRLRDIVRAGTGLSCTELHDRIQEAVQDFTGGAPQADDITLLVVEFAEP